MSPSMKRLMLRLATAAAVLVPLVLVATEALARPGGGESYSGGGGGGGGGFGGGGGGDGELVGLFTWLLFRHPQIGIPVLVVAGVVFALKHRAAGGQRDWSTSAPPLPSPRRTLERLRGLDPDFSLVLFEDFVYALYARAHELRGRGELEHLSGYLGPEARAALAGLGSPASVHGVVVGSMRVLAVGGLAPGAPRVGVQLVFEANYTEEDAAGAQQTWWVQEHWQLSRDPQARSRPPGSAAVLACPNCGAPLQETREGVCAHCDTRVDTGRFDWVVDGIHLLRREARGPGPGTQAPERGTDLPTLADPAAPARLEAMKASDAGFDWEPFAERVRLIHREMNAAWSEDAWQRSRPYLSDALFQMQQYWLETYRRQGLRNVTENARVTRLDLAAVTGDRWYHAITVRVFATGLDYTVRREGGQVVSGSRSRERPYSEYWTLIRSVEARGEVHTTPSCPNCGAPLDAVNMAGVCGYCSAHVTTGRFDWVLSRIEQDEAYTG